jgi:hypothetical protein
MPVGAPNPRFQVMRERVGQEIGAQAQQNQDALKRRFAALGGLNTGSAIKAQQSAQQQGNEMRSRAMREIDAQEADQDFQRQEARDVMKAQQDFQAGEAGKQRDFQASQGGLDRAFQERVFAFDSASKLRQLDLAERDFRLREDESEFNKRMAKWQASNSGGFFGAGGFLGLGIGGKGSF